MSTRVESEIAKAIIKDLIDRRGFRQEWDSCDSDVKTEIQTTWEGIIHKILRDSK